MEHFGTILDMIFQVFGTVNKIQGPAAEASAFRYNASTEKDSTYVAMSV